MNFLSAKQTGERWGISPRRVAVLCKEGRIPDAQLVGRSWVVPADAKKPGDARIKTGKYIRNKGNEPIERGTKK